MATICFACRHFCFHLLKVYIKLFLRSTVHHEIKTQIEKKRRKKKLDCCLLTSFALLTRIHSRKALSSLEVAVFASLCRTHLEHRRNSLHSHVTSLILLSLAKNDRELIVSVMNEACQPLIGYECDDMLALMSQPLKMSGLVRLLKSKELIQLDEIETN